MNEGVSWIDYAVVVGYVILVVFIGLAGSLFIHIGVSLYAGSLVINTLLGFSTDLFHLFITALIIAAVSGLYTSIGGLFSVAITDMLQTLTLIAGSAVVAIIAYQ